MEDLIIELYRFIVANNILNSLTRNFRRDLAIFKPEYRATREFIRMRNGSRV
jgi:hypothetical protein